MALKGIKMNKNWITTLGGLLAGLPAIIETISPIVPPKYAAIISAIGMIITGVAAKDFNVSGTSK